MSSTPTAGGPDAVVVMDPIDSSSARVRYELLGDMSDEFRFFAMPPPAKGRARRPSEHDRGGSDGGITPPSHVIVIARADGELVGIGEYVTGIDPAEAIVGFAVADGARRRDIASVLLARLAKAADGAGIRRFAAAVLPDRADVQPVLRTVGFTALGRLDDVGARLTLDVASIVGSSEI